MFMDGHAKWLKFEAMAKGAMDQNVDLFAHYETGKMLGR